MPRKSPFKSFHDTSPSEAARAELRAVGSRLDAGECPFHCGPLATIEAGKRCISCSFVLTIAPPFEVARGGAGFWRRPVMGRRATTEVR